MILLDLLISIKVSMVGVDLEACSLLQPGPITAQYWAHALPTTKVSIDQCGAEGPDALQRICQQ